ncbi:hypothetical protein LCIT_05200 [Leuconostoc citreum]|uniref:Glycosyltransferase 2-like domain-containing protein n=1 Tax=Leuconostoc citreum TaxID=33964 RepID=A0A5A5TYL0_LEUCI|nr:glycosyltransferase [Leuconostoc citreum]GDZ83278.1 hypothetical protein LCIT_05200 [Leuconostoc citreum]
MGMSRDEFKVLIIIAYANAENYIRRALDSLVGQTMNQDDLEVIIVDDKGTKHSKKSRNSKSTWDIDYAYGSI